MAEYLEPRKYLAMTVIPLAASGELFMDGPRNILYSSDGSTIRRYNVQTGTLLAPIAVNAPLLGFDVTPDGNFLYASGTRGVIKKINVSTGALSNLNFTPDLSETVTWDLSIGGNRAFFTANFSGSGWTLFRQIDLATDAISVRSDYDVGSSSGKTRQRSLLNRSFDWGGVFLQEANTSNGPIAVYQASTNTWNGSSTGHFAADMPGAISRDRKLVANDGDYDTGIRDTTFFSKLRGFGDINGGMIFDPLRDVFYGVNSTTNQIIAYDTNTWAEKYRIEIGFDVQVATPFGAGQMAIDDSGTKLFLGTGSSVLMANIPQPTGQAAGLAAGNFPSFIKVGVTGELTVRAVDPTNAPAPGYRGTVHFTSNDASAVLPADYTFTAEDNGVHTFTLALGSVGTRSITVSDAVNSFTATQGSIAVHNAPVSTIPISDIRDAVFDPSRNRLYFTTGRGTLERFNFATDSFLSPFVIGDPLEGLDITPDGNYAYIAIDAHTATEGFLKKIDLNSGQITTLPFALSSLNEAAEDVVIASNGKGFVVTQTPTVGATGMRELDLANDTISPIPGIRKTAYHELNRTADHRFVIATEGENSSFWISIYDAESGIWQSYAPLATDPFRPAAISREGRMIGVAREGVERGIDLLDRNRLFIKTIGESSDGIMYFHPTANVFYAMARGTFINEIIAYDTDTLLEKYRIPVGDYLGRLLMDDAGERLFLFAGGVQIYNLQSDKQGASIRVSGYPAYVKQGLSQTVTLTVRDVVGEIATQYRGTVHFTSSDPKAILPPDYTFTAADNGVHSFQITLSTFGYQTITARDKAVFSISGTSRSSFIHTGTSDLVLGDRRDLVFDRIRNLLYISTGEGNIERYDRATQSLLPPIIIGSPLNGMDITPDGQYLLVADSVRRLTKGVIYKIHLDNGTVTPLTYDLAPGEAGAWEVVIASNGKALISTVQQTSALVPLRTLDLSTDTFTSRMMVRGNTDISRGESRDTLFLSDAATATGPVYTYDAASDSFGETRNLGSANTNSVSSVSRDGNLIATELAGRATILRSSDLSTVTNLSNITGGVFFDPTSDQLFGLDAASFFIMYCYDTTDWSIKWQVDIRSRIVDSIPLRYGMMAVSGDGKYLFISSANDPAVIKIHSTLGIIGPAEIPVGTPSTYTVTVRNPAGAIDTRYRGTIHFTSTDPAAVLPADYTFTAADAGVHTFNVTFNTVSQTSLTVTDILTNEIGIQGGIVVSGIQNVSGVLSVYGTSGNDTILLRGDENTVSLNGMLFNFNPSQVTAFDFHTFSGNDSIWTGAGSPSPAFELPDGLIDAGAGADQVEFLGGRGFNLVRVIGGDDNDIIILGNSAEVLLDYDGGTGEDSLNVSQPGLDFEISSTAINIDNRSTTIKDVERPTVFAQIPDVTFTVNQLAATQTLLLVGTNAADTAMVLGAAAGSLVTFDSMDGDDVLVVGSGALGTVNLVNPLSPAGQDSASFDGSDSNQTFQIRDGKVSISNRIFNFAGLSFLLINGNGGNDVFDVQYSTALPLLQIDGGDGADTFTLKTLSGTASFVGGAGNDVLSALAGLTSFAFDGGAGTDSATIATNDSPLIVDATSVTNGSRVIAYSQLEGLTATGLDESSTFAIRGTSIPVSIDAGAGDDIINVGEGNLDALAARVTVNGGSGPDTINIYDQANPRTDAYTLSSTSLTRAGVPLVTYSNASNVNFFGGSANNTISITGRVGLSVTNVDAGDGNDTIGLSADISTTTLNVAGGSGNDVFNYAMTALRTVTFAGGTGQDTLNVNAGTFTFSQDAQLTTTALSVNVANAATLVLNSSQNLAALSVLGGGRATLSANGSRVLVTQALQVLGKLDLTNNDLIVQATAVTRQQVLMAIEGYINTSFKTIPTHWQGNGIGSSVAASNASRGLGAILNSGPTHYATYDGEPVDENSILVAFTLVGDLNLDKTVTISDFIDLSSNFGQIAGWRAGDVNYDKNVTISDFIDLAANFGQSLMAPPPAIAAAPAASQQLAMTTEEVALFHEPDVVVRKKNRPLIHDRPLRYLQVHHRRHEHKRQKWRSRAGAY